MAALSVTEDFRCSPWTRAQGVDPVGSAARFDRLVLVEMPLPWPNDVSEFADLASASGQAKLTRVMAIVPDPTRDPSLALVTRWERLPSGQMAGREVLLPRSGLSGALDALVDGHPGQDWDLASPAPPEILVCSHGKRDRCCGSMGTQLALDLAGNVGGTRVRRCSHTGGHRFAPTALTLPDGRYWAYLDPATCTAIVARDVEPAALRAHYRGSSSLDEWVQPVEREVLVRLGWEWSESSVTGCEVHRSDDGRSAQVALQWEGAAGPGSAQATVVVARDLPVLVCGAPPSEATKISREFRVTDLELG